MVDSQGRVTISLDHKIMAFQGKLMVRTSFFFESPIASLTLFAFPVCTKIVSLLRRCLSHFLGSSKMKAGVLRITIQSHQIQLGCQVCRPIELSSSRDVVDRYLAISSANVFPSSPCQEITAVCVALFSSAVLFVIASQLLNTPLCPCQISAVCPLPKLIRLKPKTVRDDGGT